MKPIIVSGVVRTGKRMGRTLGFPTANIAMPVGVALPENGVYVGRVTLPNGERWPCVLNQGNHPTLPKGGASVEAHLLGFEGDLYGQRIDIEYLHRLRPERRFPSVEALTEQIERDKQAGLRWFDGGAAMQEDENRV